MMNPDSAAVMAATAQIVVCELNRLGGQPRPVRDVIMDVRKALTDPLQEPKPEPVELVPAVHPRNSIRPDYLVCLDDGKKFKSLKRHLASLGMTPDEYRAKWGLPADYPMVAPNYSAVRSQLAKDNGLGTRK